MHKSQWLTQLKAFSENLYRKQPIPERNTLTPEEEWQCRIIGGDLIGWQQHSLPHIAMNRHALKSGGFDPQPVLIFTSNMAGLVAAQEILSQATEIVYLPHHSFTEWCQANPMSMTSYIHQWSYFKPLTGDYGAADASQKYPTVAPEDFRLHVSGDLWGDHCGSEQSHLWQWNGEELVLLQEGFIQLLF